MDKILMNETLDNVFIQYYPANRTVAAPKPSRTRALSEITPDGRIKFTNADGDQSSKTCLRSGRVSWTQGTEEDKHGCEGIGEGRRGRGTSVNSPPNIPEYLNWY